VITVCWIEDMKGRMTGSRCEGVANFRQHPIKPTLCLRQLGAQRQFRRDCCRDEQGRAASGEGEHPARPTIKQRPR